MKTLLPKIFLTCFLLSALSCGIETRSCSDNADCFDRESCQKGICTDPTALLTRREKDASDTDLTDVTQTCGPLDCKLCENGKVDDGEECDSQIALTETCATRGYSSGELKCSKCKFDESSCVVLETCSDNGLDEGELCDGDVFLDDKTCESQGFDGGELKCSNGCSIQTDACFKCGDAQINGDEVCDGTDFGGKTCDTEIGLVGPLSCSDDCSTINTASCGEGVRQISSGRQHSCLLKTDGTLDCWGSNENDALLFPITGTYSKVVSGDAFSCALETNGDVRCWGRFYGSIPEGKTFDDIAGGNRHICGREKSTQKLICWGGSESGKTNAPDTIFTAFSAGGNHSCGIKEDKTLECWGNEPEFFGMPSDGVFASIASGGSFSCGLLENGTPLCFGNDDDGLSDRLPGDYVQLAAGTTHVCGLLSNGEVQCWGNLQEDKGHLIPPSGVKFTQISAGLFFTCGITRAAEVLCWGTNEQNQLTPPSL